ncbi:uncharacterized protein F54H12.2-like [Belonocnema kinseyi]|uniref:uncharacterized protein F54H12.2-like n=1 Tax=Belonocnema kinseyi TaxID=2817044 RepID=UPI00143D7ABE|nr:uncharacterized protein F54H12.2-like [Belonocnema kinseyi]
MFFFHLHSSESLKTELDLFSLPPTQTSIESSQWVHYKPVSSLKDDSPIEFVIPCHGEEYIDLAHTILSVLVKVESPTETSAIAGGLKSVSVINNLLHSMFNQVDVYFNQKLVSPPNNTYAYRAYLEILLNYGSAAKKSHLTSALWAANTTGEMEDLTTKDTGIDIRRDHFGAGTTIDLIDHLHCDIFNQNKLLLNGVEMLLRLVRAKYAFCLMDPVKACSLHILEASLLVRRSKLSPCILLAHAKALSQGTTKYPIMRARSQALTLHGGIYDETHDDVILGQLPKRIIIDFVENRTFNEIS